MIISAPKARIAFFFRRMSITIAPADLNAQRQIIVDTLLRYLTDQSDQRRFEWLYKIGAHGEAKAWFAIDKQSNRVVGLASAFPRQFYSGDREISAWVLGDFCLDPQYRSLGPALQLQRACLGVMGSNRGTFCYDFPSASMVAVYNRMGFAVTAKLLRFAKLLRVDRKLREAINLSAGRRALSTAGNAFLRLTRRKRRADSSIELNIHQKPCGEEFSTLASEQRGRMGICIQRSAAYLNWRYVNNPLARCEFITARKRGRLKGYAVWTQAGEDAYLLDWFGENDPVIGRALLAETAAHLSTRGVMTLNVWLMETHPWLPWCSESGFRVRDDAPVVFVPASSLATTVNVEGAGCFLMQGDRDS